jgi:hypothetical protein
MNRAVAVGRLRFVFVCLGLVGLTCEAWADWAVVTVGRNGSRDGSVGRSTVELVRSRAEARLRGAEYNTLNKESAAQVGVTDQAIGRCVQESAACMKKALGAAEVDRLVHFELVPVSPGYRVTARLYHGTQGTLLGKEERRCTECKDKDALGRTVEELTTALLEKTTGASGPETWLEIITDPPGATVRIDGDAVGPSGRAYAVTAGQRIVRVELDGYDPAEKTVDAAAEQTTPVSITLSKHIDTPPEPRRFGAWKWVTLGAGVGLTTTGVIVTAMHGPSFDENGMRLPEHGNTLGLGVSAVATGVCLIGLSAFFFHHDAMLPKTDPAPKGLTLHRYGDGWGLGLSGRF